jgi:adenylate cyclase, class 2
MATDHPRAGCVTGALTTRRNVELKALDPRPDVTLNICRSIEAIDEGVIWQRDTYFDVSRGTLKLREESRGGPHLIQYQRADEPQQRQSSYRIVSVADPGGLQAALEAALGVRGAVKKRRHLFLWQTVRIHLDDVAGLGHFIELEAVAPVDSDLGREHQLIAQLRDVFAITDDRLCARGYADSLLGRRKLEQDWQHHLSTSLPQRVRALRVPALVLHGEADPLPASGAHELADLLPDAEWTLLPKVGHIPWLERTTELQHALRAFLRRFDG